MKKLIPLLLMILFLFLPAFIFGRELEIEWPDIPGVVTPGIGVSLEELAVYIYHFFLFVGALIALAMLIYAGFLYLTSFGNPKIMSEARQRMISCFLGLLLLFSSYIILRTIDPKLTVPGVELREEAPELPPIIRVEIEPVMPKSYTQLTTFEQNTDNTINFLREKIFEFEALDLPGRIRATLGLLETLEQPGRQGHQDDTPPPPGEPDQPRILGPHQAIDCSDASTVCRRPVDIRCNPCPGGTPTPVSCRWPTVPAIVLETDFNTQTPLPGLEQIIAETVASEQAKKLIRDLRILSNCLLEGGKDVLINSQAEQKDFLDHFNIGNRNPLYFYCFGD